MTAPIPKKRKRSNFLSGNRARGVHTSSLRNTRHSSVTYTIAIEMSDHEDHDFATTDSGASTTYPKQCSAIRKGEYVMIKNRPCKVVEMSTSKTGKHGHAKVHMVAIDIFTGKKLEDICPSTHNMDCPNVKKKEYQLLSITDGYVSLMDLDTCDTKDDLRLPEGDLGDQIQQAFEKEDTETMIAVTSAVGEEMILGFKNAPVKN